MTEQTHRSTYVQKTLAHSSSRFPLQDALTSTRSDIDHAEPTSMGSAAHNADVYDDHGETTLDDEVEDDEEFQSHYSRQSSATSSASESEGGEFDGRDEPGQSPFPRQPDTQRQFLQAYEPDNGTINRVTSLPSDPYHTALYNHHVQSHLSSSRSLANLNQQFRYPPPLPPFYNKPPTPLPPSPSLTSLLRPPSLLARSATSTRPTTPDSLSDAETPNDTEAAVSYSARRTVPVPPTAPKVPTYEYYGFVLYLASTLAFLMYILWSFLPSPFLHAMGITYYPDRWWALAIPAWLTMLVIFIYVALAAYNLEYLTLGLSRLENFVDDAGSVAILDDRGKLVKGGSKNFVAELQKANESAMMSTGSGRRRKHEQRQGHGGTRSGKRRKDRDRDKKVIGNGERWYGYNGEMMKDGDSIEAGLSWRQIWNEGTDAVLDVPLGGVCEVLYGGARDMY